MSTEKDRAAAREALMKAACREILGGEFQTFERPLAVLASPAWRGVEGDVWLATCSDRSIIAKLYHPDTSIYVDVAAAIEAAKQAGESGIGPKVILSNTEAGLLIFEHLADPWAAGGLHHVVDPEIRNNVIAAKKAFHSGQALSRSADIFEEIDVLYSHTQSQSIRTHRDVAIFQDFFVEARAKILSLGRDSRPCHRDGNTANLMVHADKSVKLIDFDLAANCDPFEDVGCHLAEFFENEADARLGFEEWVGYFNEGQFQRAMLYGMADDMRWGLIGSIMAAVSPRRHLEFGKYASWRFLRLEMNAKRSDANDRIRKVA